MGGSLDSASIVIVIGVLTALQNASYNLSAVNGFVLKSALNKLLFPLTSILLIQFIDNYQVFIRVLTIFLLFYSIILMKFRVDFLRVKEFVLSHQNHLKSYVPASVLDSIAFQFPNYVGAILMPTEYGGPFIMAYRILCVPLTLLNGSIIVLLQREFKLKNKIPSYLKIKWEYFSSLLLLWVGGLVITEFELPLFLSYAYFLLPAILPMAVGAIFASYCMVIGKSFLILHFSVFNFTGRLLLPLVIYLISNDVSYFLFTFVAFEYMKAAYIIARFKNNWEAV